MQVNKLEELDSHVIIGGNQVKSFGMADNAEFFTLLSDSLYSNKPLAVVREVLCNAWDAHIAAGITDQYVDVTFENDKLVFRDYGFGIHPKDMHPIYCVYGNSTKKDSKSETGGFGLGSKAPFAYTDHFTVTSRHLGSMSVYAISRGSLEAGGKPDIRTMVTAPCTDTGLEVSISIKKWDHGVFLELVKTVARGGGMNVRYNGVPITDILEMDSQYTVVMADQLSLQDNYTIFVRYGSVIYPIPEHDDYQKIYNKVRKICVDDGFGSNGRRLIIQAAPDTLAITPSRESLSMNEFTRNTIYDLLNDVYEDVKDAIPDAIRDILKTKYENVKDHDESMQKLIYILDGSQKLLPDTETEYKGFDKRASLARIACGLYNRPKDIKGLKRDDLNDIITLEARKYFRYYAPYFRMVQKISTRYHEKWHRRKMDIYRNVWNRYVVYKVSPKLGELEQYIRIHAQGKIRVLNYKHLTFALHPNKITVGTSQYALLGGAVSHYSSTSNLLLLVPYKKGFAQKVIDKLEADFFDVVDVTDIKKERTYYKSDLLTDPNYKPAPRKVGLVKLSEMITTYGHLSSKPLSEYENDKRETSPDFILLLDGTGTGNGTKIFESSHDLRPILKHFPNTVVASSTHKLDKYLENGAKMMEDVLLELYEKHKDDERLYWASFLANGSKNLYIPGIYVFELGRYDKDIARYFKYKIVKDKEILALAEIMSGNRERGKGKMYLPVYELKNNVEEMIKNHPPYQHLIQNNEHLNLVHVRRIRDALDGSHETHRKLAKKFIMAALKG